MNVYLENIRTEEKEEEEREDGESREEEEREGRTGRPNTAAGGRISSTKPLLGTQDRAASAGEGDGLQEVNDEAVL